MTSKRAPDKYLLRENYGIDPLADWQGFIVQGGSQFAAKRWFLIVALWAYHGGFDTGYNFAKTANLMGYSRIEAGHIQSRNRAT